MDGGRRAVTDLVALLSMLLSPLRGTTASVSASFMPRPGRGVERGGLSPEALAGWSARRAQLSPPPTTTSSGSKVRTLGRIGRLAQSRAAADIILRIGREPSRPSKAWADAYVWPRQLVAARGCLTSNCRRCVDFAHDGEEHVSADSFTSRAYPLTFVSGICAWRKSDSGQWRHAGRKRIHRRSW
jgi:hypothetical protein